MGTVISIRSETPTERLEGTGDLTSRTDRHLPFTPQKIDALVRSGTSGYFYDTKTPGLAVRIGKTKAVYLHVVRTCGTYQRHTLGNTAGMLLADARQAVVAAAGTLAKGGVLVAPRQARKVAREAREAAKRRDDFTLDGAFEDFLEKRELKAKTRTTYLDVWQHVPDSMKTTPLAALDPATVTDLHRRVGGKRKRTANKLIALISAICNASGRRHDNPTIDVKRYSEKPRTRRLTREESARLKAVLATERNHPDHGRNMLAVFVSVAYHTGARRAAIASMRWADLDLRPSCATWVVPALWSKNGSELVLALTDATAGILIEWRNRCLSKTWVFPSSGAAAGFLQEPKKGFARICHAANINGLTLHDLRRSLGSEIAAAGGNAATIAAALGHLSSQSARSYLHLNTGEVRSALESLNRND